MKLNYFIAIVLVVLVIGCAKPEMPAPAPEPVEPVLQEPEARVTETDIPEPEPEPEPEPAPAELFDAVSEKVISNFSCSEDGISFTLTNVLDEDIYFMKLSPYETAEKRGGRLSLNGMFLELTDLCGLDVLPAGKAVNCAKTFASEEDLTALRIRTNIENGMTFITQGVREEKRFNC